MTIASCMTEELYKAFIELIEAKVAERLEDRLGRDSLGESLHVIKCEKEFKEQFIREYVV